MARSLWPREHGAYAQLGAPLAGALLARVPTVAAIGFAVAACCAFVANEPLLVVRGHRGARALASDGVRARRRLVWLALIGAAAAALGFGFASPDARLVAVVAAIPALALVGLAWRRAQHSLAGELVATLAFPGAAAPVAVASGASVGAAAALWALWSLGYACSVGAVHRVLDRHRKPAAPIDGLLAAAFAGIAATLVVARAWLPLPLVAASLALVVRPPPATKLRVVGVALVVASLVADVLLVG